MARFARDLLGDVLRAGIVLLVAMVGAIVLTHRDRKDTRGQNISRQIARKPGEATVNTRPEVGQGIKL